jgi:hypothetical protein
MSSSCVVLLFYYYFYFFVCLRTGSALLKRTSPFINTMHCTENRIYVFPKKELRCLSPKSYIHVLLSDLYIPKIRFKYLAAAKQTDWSWKYINLSQKCECRNWEAEHYNSVLEITRLSSCISGNTYVGTRHLYWILTGPSFAMLCSFSRQNPVRTNPFSPRVGHNPPPPMAGWVGGGGCVSPSFQPLAVSVDPSI